MSATSVGRGVEVEGGKEVGVGDGMGVIVGIGAGAW